MGESWESRESRRKAGKAPAVFRRTNTHRRGEKAGKGHDSRPQGVKGDRVHPASKKAQQAPLAK